MNILLTNDDGISCEGLLRLADALRELKQHTIYVLAPDRERSGVSNCISFYDSIRIRDLGNNTWTCSGTPADCALLGILGALPVKPDLVVSGINAGANLGTDLVYSGTAAAARQAALHGIPAIALSLVIHEGPVFWEPAVAYARDHLEELIAFWKEDTFVNVNFPNSPSYTAPPVLSFPSRRRYQDSLTSFDAPDGYRYCFVKGSGVVVEDELDSDSDAVSRNRVSMSPVFIHPVVLRDICSHAPEHSITSARSAVVNGKR
ncbi:5'-nucleotidase SurE (Nucleoside 5'-monophosphatephosphohydrolase) [Treponema primitia ZAS-2]|uniref:5'-nucleotidase SurE n=1 Tax=Treponema primitia (strain ATCC BAA-887 / DSM 12427 / ZAS-2) TaxID=545694 RepID=F5YPY9_TREPZ|nr:5'/3'-nucleotidase SurE [Treponema primitia]AEF84276.1 5'-nucleotidase SurE (Nucleoside 5'-monophosphatephosphohydrolase) [Treponema primitia ZAS-2]